MICTFTHADGSETPISEDELIERFVAMNASSAAERLDEIGSLVDEGWLDNDEVLAFAERLRRRLYRCAEGLS